MLIDLQGNIGTSINNPTQYSFNDIIFCNTGGKENMSLTFKNIPPMEHNDIPSEIQIKNKDIDSVYKKIKSYNKDCWLNISCTDEIPMFRFQVVYDGYDFLYYPEFKLYERPSLLMDYNVTIGTNIITFDKSSENASKDIAYLEAGKTIVFKDYNDEYTIQSVTDNPTSYAVYLDRDVDQEYYKNDLIIFNNNKYELQSNSNILTDSTINDLSPFKFKFINSFDAKNWYMLDSLGKEDDYTLTNNVYDQIVDLQGDDKIVSISNDVDITYSDTIALNTNLTISDTVLELTSPPDTPLDVYSYITVKSSSGIEILKIKEVNSTVNFTVDRGQLNTSIYDHNSGEALIYFPKNVYFVMLPYNKELTKRYVAYRNIDFVINQV